MLQRRLLEDQEPSVYVFNSKGELINGPAEKVCVILPLFDYRNHDYRIYAWTEDGDCEVINEFDLGQSRYYSYEDLKFEPGVILYSTDDSYGLVLRLSEAGTDQTDVVDYYVTIDCDAENYHYELHFQQQAPTITEYTWVYGDGDVSLDNFSATVSSNGYYNGYADFVVTAGKYFKTIYDNDRCTYEYWGDVQSRTGKVTLFSSVMPNSSGDFSWTVGNHTAYSAWLDTNPYVSVHGNGLSASGNISNGVATISGTAAFYIDKSRAADENPYDGSYNHEICRTTYDTTVTITQ